MSITTQLQAIELAIYNNPEQSHILASELEASVNASAGVDPITEGRILALSLAARHNSRATATILRRVYKNIIA
jgi:hypothetical protein